MRHSPSGSRLGRLLTPSAMVATVLASSACTVAPATTVVEPVVVAAPAPPEPAAVLRVRNNHDFRYDGPVRLAVDLPDGSYAAPNGRAHVRQGIARVLVSLDARDSVVLQRRESTAGEPFVAGSFSVEPSATSLALGWKGEPVGTLELGLAAIPGKAAQTEDAVGGFAPLTFTWALQPDGSWTGRTVRDGYSIEVDLARYGTGFLDIRARLTRAAGAEAPAYLGLVRRLTTPAGVSEGRVRFNGREFPTTVSPDTWDRDFWYVRGVDWMSWTSDSLALAMINGFTPAPTVNRNNRWAVGSQFYVTERTRQDGDALFFISQVSGPNPEQEKSRYMPVTPYAPLIAGDTVDLEWRLAVSSSPRPDWQESQLHVFSGYRSVDTVASGIRAAVELGVPYVTFGTSYFPYSTLTENFDFYRTAGQDRETFWAFSPVLWAKWRELEPRMRGDLHIIRAMGFDVVRLHHLELLTAMERAEALAFLDFFTGVARELDMKILLDTEGPVEWVSEVATRYRDVLAGVEIENEVLIGGVKPGDAERWTAIYEAAKAGAPDADVFLTTAANHGMFERIMALGVPFDRVGVHAYKHGPQWKESFSSHMLATADYASDLGLQSTLGEFNWKELTRLSPEERLPEFTGVYEAVLGPRAIPDVVQFQLQESLSFNPAISGTYTRHYETLSLDRRPKPEAFELMRLVRKYGPPDAPGTVLPVTVPEVRMDGAGSTAKFTVENRTGRVLTVALKALAFDGIRSTLTTPASVTLQPGQKHEGAVELLLTGDAIGTYHHFIRADFDGEVTVGWGIAANPGAPTFEKSPALTGFVRYPQGPGVVDRIDWDRPIAVAYGDDASVIEVETAYTLTTTLQSATGRPVRLSSVSDLPDSLRRDATLVLLGTAASNALIGESRMSGVPKPAELPAAAITAGTRPAANAAAARRAAARRDPGIVLVRDAAGSGQWVVLTGASKEAVQAASIDFVLRYWKNAKDATTRISGMEPGNALGHRAIITVADPP